MHTRIVSGLVALLCTSFVFSQNLTADEQRVKDLKEKVWPKACKEQNTTLLDKILAEEFFMIDADGNTFSKSQEIEYHQQNKPTYESFTYHVGRLLIFDHSTAIMNGLAVITGTDDHGAYTTTYQSSDVMIKRNGEWQTVSSHISGMRKDYEGGD